MKQETVKVPQADWTAQNYSQGKIASYKPFNFVDGQGVRCSLYVSGCLFQCPGCYNAAAQNFRYGIEYDQTLEEQILQDLGQEYCQGLSLLGGEPFLNTQVCLSLVTKLRQRYGHSKDVWVWSGYTWDQLLEGSPDKQDLLKLIDVLVDGPYLQEYRDLNLAFRGSSNQRILQVPASLASGQPVLWSGA